MQGRRLDVAEADFMDCRARYSLMHGRPCTAGTCEHGFSDLYIHSGTMENRCIDLAASLLYI